MAGRKVPPRRSVRWQPARSRRSARGCVGPVQNVRLRRVNPSMAESAPTRMMRYRMPSVMLGACPCVNRHAAQHLGAGLTPRPSAARGRGSRVWDGADMARSGSTRLPPALHGPIEGRSRQPGTAVRRANGGPPNGTLVPDQRTPARPPRNAPARPPRNARPPPSAGARHPCCSERPSTSHDGGSASARSALGERPSCRSSRGAYGMG
jgi:hypothetical protein